jgi:hypothetical protein
VSPFLPGNPRRSSAPIRSMNEEADTRSDSYLGWTIGLMSSSLPSKITSTWAHFVISFTKCHDEQTTPDEQDQGPEVPNCGLPSWTAATVAPDPTAFEVHQHDSTTRRRTGVLRVSVRTLPVRHRTAMMGSAVSNAAGARANQEGPASAPPPLEARRMGGTTTQTRDGRRPLFGRPCPGYGSGDGPATDAGASVGGVSPQACTGARVLHRRTA